MENITIAIINGLCVAVPSIIATLSSNKSSIKLIDHKINELTNHVNKHNNLIDRMYKLESRVSLLEKDEK